MSTETLLAIDRNIEQAKAMIETGTSLDRLRSNRDFKRVILDGYLRDEAIRLVHLKADTNMQTPERQKTILQQIDAIGALAQYLNTVDQLTNMARNSLAADEATREELLSEDLING